MSRIIETQGRAAGIGQLFGQFEQRTPGAERLIVESTAQDDADPSCRAMQPARRASDGDRDARGLENGM